jgi:hypothetical protein
MGYGTPAAQFEKLTAKRLPRSWLHEGGGPRTCGCPVIYLSGDDIKARVRERIARTGILIPSRARSTDPAPPRPCSTMDTPAQARAGSLTPPLGPRPSGADVTTVQDRALTHRPAEG